MIVVVCIGSLQETLFSNKTILTIDTIETPQNYNNIETMVRISEGFVTPVSDELRDLELAKYYYHKKQKKYWNMINKANMKESGLRINKGFEKKKKKQVDSVPRRTNCR